MPGNNQNHTMNEILHTWHDSTTYSRDDENRVPTCWDYNTGKLRITITNNHRQVPGRWVLHCHKIGMDTVIMNVKHETPVSDVQAVAIRIVKRVLSEMLTSFVSPENATE